MSYYNYDWDWREGFESLKGKTIKAIEVNTAADEIRFSIDGDTYVMYHPQSCCECVSIHEIVGDLDDLIDTPILVAEERSNAGDDADGYGVEEWTFYELRTIKGSVTISWYGSSNGYYSTSVDFVKLKP